MNWAIGLGGVAFLALFVIPVWGARKFSPRRAQMVKHAESITEIVVRQQVIELAVHHPEIVKRHRVDRHWFYLWPHVGVLCYATCILFGATPTSNVISMTQNIRDTMAVCFLIGSALVLTGSSMGARIGPWTIGRKFVDHDTASLMGDDVVLPYRVGIGGLGCAALALSIYAGTSFQSTNGSLGGWLTLTLAGASFSMIVDLFLRSQRFKRDETVLLSEVWSRIERDSHEFD